MGLILGLLATVGEAKLNLGNDLNSNCTTPRTIMVVTRSSS
jgi:hypothetical protein